MKIRNRGRNNPIYQKDKYQPGLFTAYYNEVKSADSREARSEIDPIAYGLTTRVANLITKNPPIFLDKEENELEEIREAWVKEDYDTIFREVIRTSRTHGFCVTESLAKPFAGQNFMVHDLTDMIHMKYDESWNIELYRILPKMEVDGEKMHHTSLPKEYDLKSAKALHYAIGKRKVNQQGLSILKPVWAQLVRANEILESMAMYDSRIGHGVLVVKIDPDLYQDDIADLQTAVRTMNNRRYILLKEKHDQPAEMKFIGAEGTKMDFPRDLESIMGYIAAASGFPIRYFVGDPKGALSASKEDKVAVYQNLQAIFAEYKNWIRDFIVKFVDGGEVISSTISEIEFDHEGILDSLTDDMEGEEGEEGKFVANEAQKEVTK